ncbi:MAG: hypothetical protein ACFE9Z_10240 [Promethearchaeota archaeon]
MAWTPPSKFTVFLTCILMLFGIFILLDMSLLIWGSILPYFAIGTENGWIIIALIVLFLSWFLFFLGVKMKGL